MGFVNLASLLLMILAVAFYQWAHYTVQSELPLTLLWGKIQQKHKQLPMSSATLHLTFFMVQSKVSRHSGITQKSKTEFLSRYADYVLLKTIMRTYKAVAEISQSWRAEGYLVYSTPGTLSREELTKAEKNAVTHTVGKSLIIKDAQQDIVNQWGSTGKHLQLDFIDVLCLFFPKTRQLFCTQNLKLDFISNNILLVISVSGNVWLFYLCSKHLSCL